MKDHAPAGTIELCGEWELTDGTGEHRVPMALSGNAGLKRVGFRTDSSMARNEIGDGALGIRVHGRDVVCCGADWISADALADRIARERPTLSASRPLSCGDARHDDKEREVGALAIRDLHSATYN